MGEPLVSVVMAVYNAEPYVGEAIASLRRQTFDSWELIVVDDGSTDGSRQVLERAADRRVRVLAQAENGGQARARNLGLRQAQGRYVACLDADDLALPTRLERQVGFLQRHPEMAVVGSSVVIIDGQGRAKGRLDMPRDEAEIKWTALRGCPFVHSSVTLAREALEDVGGYPEEPHHRYVEDYVLWSRLARGWHMANLAEPLVEYRDHAGSESVRVRPEQARRMLGVARENVGWTLGEEPVTATAWSGFVKFACSPAGTRVTLDRQELRGTLGLIRRLSAVFYARYGLAGAAARAHRRRAMARWARRCLGLACRDGVGLSAAVRLELLAGALRLLALGLPAPAARTGE